MIFKTYSSGGAFHFTHIDPETDKAIYTPKTIAEVWNSGLMAGYEDCHIVANFGSDKHPQILAFKPYVEKDGILIGYERETTGRPGRLVKLKVNHGDPLPKLDDYWHRIITEQVKVEFFHEIDNQWHIARSGNILHGVGFYLEHREKCDAAFKCPTLAGKTVLYRWLQTGKIEPRVTQRGVTFYYTDTVLAADSHGARIGAIAERQPYIHSHMLKVSGENIIETLRVTVNELSHWHEWRINTSPDYRGSDGYHHTKAIIDRANSALQ